jgi:Zc3h12a-like Ribonuclease NYN domain
MAPNLPRHVVVDGSNIATEGRSHPSLKQLDEAVRAFMTEHADHTVTVVVDATFGHRIEKSEVAAFDSAIDANELVCPPAGAIGRGDAFVLQIADKADAMILSNDSFQEFHGEYEWLFDEGRLMGGKPVPHVGWVFVLRTPVRGPTSRRALRGVKKSGTAASKKRAGRPSAAASAPLPVPKSPPPGRRKAETSTAAAPAKPSASVDQKRKSADALNPLLAFVEFVAHHPVGSPVDASVESFSSHGAYVVAEGVRCYVPLRFLGKPAPRSAREVLALGENRSFTVVSIAAGRRGVDLALPGFEPEGVTVTEAPPAKRKAAPKKAKATAKSDKAAEKAPAATKAGEKKAVPKKAATKKAAPKKAATPKEVEPSKAETKKAVAKRSAPKKSAAKKTAAAKKSAASA